MSDIPEIPLALEALSRCWPRAVFLLRRIAWGYGIAATLGDHYAQQFGVVKNSGAFKSLLTRLERCGLLTSAIHSMYLGGGGKAKATLKLVELAPPGADLVRSFGWRVFPTEWQILRAKHNADLNPEHALAVALFARQVDANLRSYVICPDAPGGGHYRPDLAIHDGLHADYEYVEIERGNGNPEKWRANARLNSDGIVRLVALNPQRMMTLVRDVQALGLEVEAANLRDLLYGRADWLWQYPPDY